LDLCVQGEECPGYAHSRRASRSILRCDLQLRGAKDVWQKNMYAFRLVPCGIHSLAIRSQPSTLNEHKSDQAIEVGEIVTGSALTLAEGAHGKDGPFLQVSTDPAGWLFEFMGGKRVMAPLPVQVGRWMYRISNGSAGLALRLRPTQLTSAKCHPEVNLSSETVVLCDLLVQRPACGNLEACTFVRVMGTDGWLFASLGGQATLLSVPLHASIECAFSKAINQVSCAPWFDELLCDAVILVGPSSQAFHVHRAVLAAASSVFHAMFTSGMKEHPSYEVQLSTDKPDIVEQLLSSSTTGVWRL